MTNVDLMRVQLAGHWATRLMVVVLATVLAVTAAPSASHAAEDGIRPILDDPVDPYPSAAPAVCSNGGVYPGVFALADILTSSYGSRIASTARGCPATVTSSMSYHSRGLALDWRFNAFDGTEAARAQQVLDWLFEANDDDEAHVRLRRLGILEVIWNGRLWTRFDREATSDISTWREHNYSGCISGGGNPVTCAHQDHIHFSFSLEGGRMETSWWSAALAPYRDTPTTPAVVIPHPYFNPEEDLTRGALATWLFRFAEFPYVAGTYGDGAARPKAWLHQASVPGFAPSDAASDTIDRATFAEMLYAFDGIDGQRRAVVPEFATLEFEDLPGSATEELWLARTGLIQEFTDGDSGPLFEPGRIVTRQEAALYLYRLANTPAIAPGEVEAYADVPEAPFDDPVVWMSEAHIDKPVLGDVPMSHQFFSEIHWMFTEGISTGYEAGAGRPNTFQPSASVSRQAMAAFVHRYVGEEATLPDEPTFPDVPESHPFYESIEWMTAEGMAQGYDDGSYRPGSPVSRQAMAAFLYRLAGEPAVPSGATLDFSDVPPGHPFVDEITWLASTGITTGYDDGTFRPSATISRQAMAAFLYRFDQL